jgi:hypothetical protein
VVFPQPDSPTRPSVSPESRVKLTPSTARTMPDLRERKPAFWEKCLTKFLTSRRGDLPPASVDIELDTSQSSFSEFLGQISNIEARNLKQIRMTKIQMNKIPNPPFEQAIPFDHLNFEVVSNFDIRISDLPSW